MISQTTSRLTTWLSARQVSASKDRDLPYGVQMMLAREGGARCILCVFENKKGQVTLDVSRISDGELLGILREAAGAIGASLSKSKGERGTQAFPAGGKSEEGQTKEQARHTPAPMLDCPLIGSDESGKGDFFGGLYAAAVFADEDGYRALQVLGVADSKTLTDAAMLQMEGPIKLACPHHQVFGLTAMGFNRSYRQYGNINQILSKLHCAVIEKTVSLSGCRRVLTDRFSSTNRMALLLAPLNLEAFVEVPKAEKNLAVAAASILARVAFVRDIYAMRAKYDVVVPFGAGPASDSCARALVGRFGNGILDEATKTNFQNTGRVSKHE